MGQCQYKNLQSEHTCNIDTKLFKDENQEDLFPDFCYFHQIGCAFFDIYRVLYHNTINLSKPLNYDESKQEFNTNIKNFRYELSSLPDDKEWLYPYAVKPFITNQNKVEHEGSLIDGRSVIDLTNGIRKIDVSDPDEKRHNDIFIAFYFKIMQFHFPNLIEYYSKFDNLMSSKDYQDIEINTDGFYFPVEHNKPIKFTAKKPWINKLKITNNLFVYEYSVFENESNFNSNTMTSYLKGYYEYYANFTSSYGSGSDIFKIEFVNITFENDIQSKRIEDNKGGHTTNSSIDFLGCTFNSSNVNLQANSIEFNDKTKILEQNYNLIIETKDKCLIKNSKVESKNIVIKASSLNIEYTDLHSDNTEKIELHVPFNKLNLKNPYSMSRIFGKNAIVDIYDA